MDNADPIARPEWSGKRIVTIGGGSGPFALLSTLKRYPCSITAIVTMADSGGSSRRLMDEFGQLPLGDLRQALVALSRRGALWRDVFNFRFRQGNGVRDGDRDGKAATASSVHRQPGDSSDGTPAGGSSAAKAFQVAAQAGVSGHSLGNLIISALQVTNDGNLLMAIQDAQELLETAGDVLPVTLDHTTLCARLEDGETICGETEIDTRGVDHPGELPPIREIFLRERATACQQAVRAIRRADTIIIGPGDLYTSILPNLLVEGIAEAMLASDAEKVYVCNLMTKHGETDGYRASDFVREIHRYLGGRVDRAILHDGAFPDHVVRAYAEQQQHAVEPDVAAVREHVPLVHVEHLLTIGHDLVRHDAERLVQAAFAPRLEGL
jgi:uncharacterized cofD-like protein